MSDMGLKYIKLDRQLNASRWWRKWIDGFGAENLPARIGRASRPDDRRGTPWLRPPTRTPEVLTAQLLDGGPLH